MSGFQKIDFERPADSDGNQSLGDGGFQSPHFGSVITPLPNKPVENQTPSHDPN
jgi:hypothetical protein